MSLPVQQQAAPMLPAPWLVQCLRCCDANTRLSFIRAYKMVLNLAGPYVEVNSEGCVVAARGRLVRVLSKFALTMLKVNVKNGLCFGALPALEGLLAPLPLPSDTMGSLRGLIDITIHADTKVNTTYSVFIPQAIAESCPNLLRLQLIQNRFPYPPYQRVQPQPWQPASLKQLQELSLDKWIVDLEENYITQQMHSLSSIKRLKLVTEPTHTFSNLNYYVTELHWSSPDADILQLAWPKLWKLVADELAINDVNLPQILDNMPELEELSVNDIVLLKDNSNRSSKWRCVTLYDIPSCNSLAYMPVSSKGLDKLCYLRSRAYLLVTFRNLQPVEQRLIRAAQVVQQAGGLVFRGEGEARATISIPSLPESQPILTFAIGMFSNLKHLVLVGDVDVTSQLLTAVNTITSCTHLELADYGERSACRFHDDVCITMLCKLKRVAILTLHCALLTTDQLVILCRSADHAVTVHLYCENVRADSDSALAAPFQFAELVVFKDPAPYLHLPVI